MQILPFLWDEMNQVDSRSDSTVDDPLANPRDWSVEIDDESARESSRSQADEEAPAATVPTA
eukprot:6887259-Prymnesium_polylepis.1